MKTVIRLSTVPPSANQIWRQTRSRTTGKPVTYRSERYNTWRNAASWEARAASIGQPKWDTPVYITVAIRRPRTNSDLDNLLKPLGDLLQHVGILANDKLICGWNAYWSKDIDGVEIAITSASTDSEAA